VPRSRGTAATSRQDGEGERWKIGAMFSPRNEQRDWIGFWHFVDLRLFETDMRRYWF
jgi:hypothetical protein